MRTLCLLLLAGAAAADDGVWTALAKKYDADGDGTITATEYPRGAEKFRSLDRDGDGALTAADFAGRRSFQDRMKALRLARRADADRDGTVTAEEWNAVDGDGDAFAELDRDGSGALETAEFQRRRRDGAKTPRQGDPAPDFELPRLDGEGAVKLSSFAGDRPVALVFGSYT